LTKLVASLPFGVELGAGGVSLPLVLGSLFPLVEYIKVIFHDCSIVQLTVLEKMFVAG
jgi:hypothetical protein